MNFITRWKQQSDRLKTESYALLLAYKDPRMPWYAKAFTIGVIAYAFSPIDLIPDFIPVLGYLDDLVLIPLGIIVAIKLIPAEVMAECREKAANTIKPGIPHTRTAAAIVITLWLILAAIIVAVLLRIFTD
jgi:uncharacterized membrane protein YkvA (DUF1232 family)